MYANHEYRAELMLTVFRLNNLALLENLEPWVYRTYHTRGFSYSYFPLELSTWIEAVERHISSEQAAPLVAVYRWMLAQHDRWPALAEDKSYAAFPADASWHPKATAFLSALLQGDTRECLALSAVHVQAAEDLSSLYLQVIQPAMYRMGVLWEVGEVSVAQEHLATSIASHVVASVYSQFVPREPTKGKAIVAATPNEFHELGPRMVADLLELDGWDVTYLGVNAPAADTVAFIASHEPAVVGLSATVPFNLEPLRQLTQAIKQASGNRTRIMVGGQAFLGIADLWKHVGADGYAADASQAVVLARRWWD